MIRYMLTLGLLYLLGLLAQCNFLLATCLAEVWGCVTSIRLLLLSSPGNSFRWRLGDAPEMALMIAQSFEAFDLCHLVFTMCKCKWQLPFSGAIPRYSIPVESSSFTGSLISLHS